MTLFRINDRRNTDINIGVAVLVMIFFNTLYSTTAIAGANFEDGYYEWSLFYQTATPSIYIEPELNYGFFYERQSGMTPSGSTGPSAAANGSNHYIFFETSAGAANSENDVAVLAASTTWENTIKNAGKMSFYYHMYGADIGTLAVEVNGSDNDNSGPYPYPWSDWQRVWEISGQQHSSYYASWSKITLNLDAIKASLGINTIYSVRFKAIAKGGYRGDIAIDEIDWETSTNSTIGYRYDGLGRVVCVIDGNNGNRNFDYDDAGNRSSVSIGVCND